MKRIFLCAERFFPRGDAGANRVLYIAKAMQEKGWEPIVISIGSTSVEYYSKEEQKYVYDGIEFRNIECKTNGVPQKIERMLFNGSKTIQILKKYQLTKNDKVLIYSSTAPYTQAVLNYAKKVGASVALDIVEWHQSFQFQYGAADIRYLSFKKCFDQLTIKAKNVVAISSFLAQHFTQKGCNVLTFPIYIEAKSDYVYKPENSVLNFIYPGNPYRKDSLENMLEGIAALSSEEQSQIRLHLTGVKRNMLEKAVPGKESLLDTDCVKIHGFMEYQKLMELYESVDFALIARPDNTVTKANFPSKVPELMNRGIPVLINDIGDISKYVHDGEDAILIESATPEAVTDALRKCLKMSVQQRKEMHDKAFFNAKNNFDYHKSAKMLDCYFSTLQ